MSVSSPGTVVAAKASRVVLELDQVESVWSEEQQVDPDPVAARVPELDARPGSEWCSLQKQVTDDPQSLGFVRELGRTDFHPAIGGHARPSFVGCP